MNKAKAKRIERTVAFVIKSIGENKRILDLGVKNEMGKALQSAGFEVINTQGEDLDVDFRKYIDQDVDAITSFQIFEHMLAPFNILREMKTKQIVTSVPLNMWFAEAYWHPTDVWDRHYHDFEPKQFDMLLDRTGWEIIDSDKWENAGPINGIRPLLRRFAKRHYIVHAKRKADYVVPGPPK